MITKSDIAKAAAASTSHSYAKCKEILDSVIDHIISNIAYGEEVFIAKLGKFKTKIRTERKGRNPATGEEINVPAKVQVKFSPSGELKKELNR